MNAHPPQAHSKQNKLPKNTPKRRWPFWKFVALILPIACVLTIILPLTAGEISLGHHGLFGNWYSLFTCAAFTAIIVRIVLQHKTQEQQWMNMQNARKKSRKSTGRYGKNPAGKTGLLVHLDLPFVEQWKTKYNAEQRKMFYLQGKNSIIRDMESRKKRLTLLTCFPHKDGSAEAIQDFVDQFYFLATTCMRLSTEWKTTAAAYNLHNMSREMYNQFKHEYKRLYVKKRLSAIRSIYKYYRFCSLEGISAILQNIDRISNLMGRIDSWIKQMTKIEKNAEYYEQLILENLTKEEAICLYISRLYSECRNYEIDWDNCQRYLDQLQNLYRNRRWAAGHEMLLRLLGLHHPSLEDIDDSISIIIYKINHFDKNNTFDAEPSCDPEYPEQDSSPSNTPIPHSI